MAIHKIMPTAAKNQKMPCQLMCTSIHPPTMGAMAGATPKKMVTWLMTFCACEGANMSRMIPNAPSIIGRDFRTLSTIAYNQYTSEMGGTPTMAVSISMLMIVISMLAVLLQRHMIGKRRYAGSMTSLNLQKRSTGLLAGTGRHRHRHAGAIARCR